jgi:hypothetical protein
MTKFIIMLSDSEYVTGYESGCVSTVANVNKARQYDTEDEARDVLRKVKAKHDNGAEIVSVAA